MLKKIVLFTSILFLTLFSTVPITVYADDSDPEEPTTWVDEDGVTHEVETVQIQGSSIENGKYMPSSVTGEKFEGTGTVVDYVQSDTKTFYTIYTQDDKIYYLIIDNTKDKNNVYFLREINEDELNFGYQYEVIEDKEYADDEVVKVQKTKKTTAPSPILIGLSIAFVVGAVIFLIVNKNKNNKNNTPKSKPQSPNVDFDDMYGDVEDTDIDIDIEDDDSDATDTPVEIQEEQPAEEPAPVTQEEVTTEQPSEQNIEIVSQDEEE